MRDARGGSTHTVHAAMTPEGGRAFKVDGRWVLAGRVGAGCSHGPSPARGTLAARPQQARVAAAAAAHDAPAAAASPPPPAASARSLRPACRPCAPTRFLRSLPRQPAAGRAAGARCASSCAAWACAWTRAPPSSSRRRRAARAGACGRAGGQLGAACAGSAAPPPARSSASTRCRRSAPHPCAPEAPSPRPRRSRAWLTPTRPPTWRRWWRRPAAWVRATQGAMHAGRVQEEAQARVVGGATSAAPFACAPHYHLCSSAHPRHPAWPPGRWNDEVAAAAEELRRTRKALADVQGSLAVLVGAGAGPLPSGCC